jgi:quinohemoprotein ethanol dehydrogenase
MSRRGSLLGLLWALNLPSLGFSAGLPASSTPPVGAGADWVGHDAAADESAYSRLDQIKTSNVRRLGLAWSMDLPGEASLEATPLAVNGVLYFTGSYAAVYAVDARSGKLRWKYDPQTWQHNPAKLNYTFGANRGAAYADGRIYSAALDGRLFALDASSGKLIWSVETTTPESMYTITGAPRVFRGKVIIGNGGADFGARGYVTAFDGATGKQLWRFYVVPGSPESNQGDPVMERAAKTWTGQYWLTGTGGAVWGDITFDPELNRIYLGTGNGGPYDPTVRSPGGGDNLFTASIVALDADTGKYVWHYQAVPLDAWDYDCTQQMTLADLTIDGTPHKVLMQAPKDGFFYVLDRENGKLLSAEKYGKVTWADHIDLTTGRPVEAPNIRYETGQVLVWPAPTGAHAWQSMSFSPRTGLVYIPYMQLGVRLTKNGTPPDKGAVSVGDVTIQDYEADPLDGKGALVAYDPVQKKVAWRAQHDWIWNGGTMATAGDLVFQGTADGAFAAYDAVTGKRLWQFNAGLGIIGAPSTYVAHGKQYVSILVGYGGSSAIWGTLMDVGWRYRVQPRRLLTFELDGKAKLPPTAPADKSVKAVDVPSYQPQASDVAAGHAMWLACAACHGRDVVSAGAFAPDLRESRVAADPEALWTVLHEGPLLPNGMPRFSYLTHDQALQIYAYIRSAANDALKTTPQ